MSRARPSTGTPATSLLSRLEVAFTEHAYEHDPAVRSYGEEAVRRLGLDPARVFKTLCAHVDGSLVVAVVPVGARLDLKALAVAVGGKRAALAAPADAERATGYVVGGISPLGQRRALTTVVDDSAMALEQVYVSGGRRGLDLGLSPVDLVRVLTARTAPIGRRG